MNRRKSMAFSPNFSSPGSEKKSRSPFAFRKSESKDHTPLPSTPPNNETPDTAESVATPASSHPTRNGQRVSEDPDAITPIPEDSVAPTTNGATAHASAPSAPSEPEPAKVCPKKYITCVLITNSAATSRFGGLLGTAGTR